MLTVVTPVSLIITLALSLFGLITKGYEGYPQGTLLVFGWGIVAIFIASAVVMPKIKGRTHHNAVEHSHKGDL